RTGSPCRSPELATAPRSVRNRPNRHSAWTWSMAHQPTLCRVLSYAEPGLPSPQTTFIRARRAGSAALGRGRLFLLLRALADQRRLDLAAHALTGLRHRHGLFLLGGHHRRRL